MLDDLTNSTETSSVHWGRRTAYHGPMHWDRLGPRWADADTLEGQRGVNNNWTSLPTSLQLSQGAVYLWLRKARGGLDVNSCTTRALVVRHCASLCSPIPQFTTSVSLNSLTAQISYQTYPHFFISKMHIYNTIEITINVI